MIEKKKFETIGNKKYRVNRMRRENKEKANQHEKKKKKKAIFAISSCKTPCVTTVIMDFFLYIFLETYVSPFSNERGLVPGI